MARPLDQSADQSGSSDIDTDQFDRLLLECDVLPDAMIADIQMPGMTGDALQARLNAEDADRDHAIGHRGSATEGVGTSAGQPDDLHLVDAERVGDRAQVLREVDDLPVLVRRGRPDAGPVDADQSYAVLLGERAGRERDLATGTRSAV